LIEANPGRPLRLPLLIFRNSISKLKSSSAPESKQNGRKIRRKEAEQALD
jgi:hypothetical protein